jgi:hypothetical protein
MTDTHSTGSGISPLLRRWPVPAGLGAATLIALDLAAGVELAKVLAASAVIYLGAAALGKPGSAWPLFIGSVVVITAADLVNGGFEATWVLLGAGILLAAYGVLRGAIRPGHGLPLQALALLGFGTAAALALFINPVLGAYLVALGLLGHAAWDVYHYRANKVVVRSLAEFCFVLDTALAVAIVIVTVRA